ncbi:hypothetical protein GCM10010433_72980 [Streptomyces pulveraceus]
MDRYTEVDADIQIQASTAVVAMGPAPGGRPRTRRTPGTVLKWPGAWPSPFYLNGVDDVLHRNARTIEGPA